VDLVGARHSFFRTLERAERPLVLVGGGATTRSDGPAVLAAIAQLASAIGAVKGDWNGFAVLHTAASRVGGLDLGFVPGEGGLTARAMAASGGLDVLFNLGADEIDIAPGAFVIYQGSHGDRGAHRADVILPGAAYSEKSATFVNTEGRVQMTNRAVFPPGDAREDWAILRALSDVLGHRLPFDSLQALRKAMYGKHPHLGRLEDIAASNRGGGLSALSALGGWPGHEPFAPVIRDFYLTNPIARASRVMAECSALLGAPSALQAAE
jgi:NADH-quinone oxidoreductase subunit G